MWLVKLQQLYRDYKLRKACTSFKSKIETVTALDLPKQYLEMIKAGTAPAVNRQRQLRTSVEDVSEIIAWINAVAYSLDSGSMANKLPPPGTTVKARNVRVDKLLYDTKTHRYVDMQYVFSEIIDAYAMIQAILANRSHPSHYRAKDRTMPHIERLHELFKSIID